MNYFTGIDVGASATKAVIINAEKEAVGYSVNNSGADFRAAAETAFSKAKKNADQIVLENCIIVATGYGRRNIPYADRIKTEISCHARGSYHFFRNAHTLIDIGGQDSKVIRVDVLGKRVSFKMNRKCAAGTGAFLEEIANRLDVKLGQLNRLAEKAQKDIEIGSYCTVFTATEILTKIREGEQVENIVKGIFNSVITRAIEMDPMENNIVMTGGVVAYNPFLVKMFEEKLGKKIFVPPLPQLTGAFGAALFALEGKPTEG